MTDEILDLPHEIDGGVGARAKIGLIVLANDHTMEFELSQVFPGPDVAMYAARIECAPQITPENLADMEGRIAGAASLILPGVELSVVGFGCTSASIVIGEERVFEIIRGVHPGAACTTPITAAVAAFEALDIRRLGVVTPYRADVNEMLRAAVRERGFEVPRFGSFNEEDDNVAGRIAVESIRQAVLEFGRHDDVDGVFVSCTNLRLIGAIGELEAELGKPVVSSNQALAWHCLRLAGVDEPMSEYGRLLRE